MTGVAARWNDAAAGAVGTIVAMRQRLYYVYILASKSRRTYIGVTNNLERRIWEHWNRRFAGFISDYDITSLVHYELTP